MTQSLVERLRKRVASERAIAENALVVAALLQPEYAKFEAREGPLNLYAVRVAVDHQQSAERDTAFANDLEALLDRLAVAEEALEEAAGWFEQYATEHYAKARTAPDSGEQHGRETRGKTNADRAAKLRTALSMLKGDGVTPCIATAIRGTEG